MKKKFIVLVLLLVLVSSLTFTSCTFIQENEERVSNTVLETVTYDYAGNAYFPEQTLSLVVTRSELVSYVNYVIYLYTNYSMEYDAAEVYTSSIESLATQKYQILEGMAYLMNNCSEQRRNALYYNTQEYKDIYGTTIVPEGLLTIAERLSTVATTNESFVTSIEDYVTDYYDEIRELAISTVKENLTVHYTAGYAVAEEDGVVIAKKNSDGTYSDGLYIAELSSDDETGIDYTEVYLKITMTKTGEENFIAYLPIGEDDVTSADDEDDVSPNTHITNKIASVSYDEPVVETEEVTDDDGETTTEEVTTYTTHTATASYKLITPRTALTTDDEDDEDTDDEDTDMLDTYRYYTSFDSTDATQKTFYDDGQIFEISPTGLDDATKDAYRQFREAKKSALIGFTTDADAYNGLGYYYKSSFESAILTAVQYELKVSALTADPITDSDIETQYAILAAKQKEEYDILSYEDQVDKFATAIATDLSTCYYIPLVALSNTTYTYTDSLGAEQTRAYATLNTDGTYTIDMFYIVHILFKFNDDISAIIDRYTADLTDDDAIKAAKLNMILSIGLLNTNKSKEDYAEVSNDLSAAYYVILDTDGNPVLLDSEGNKLSAEDRLVNEDVKDVYNALVAELATVTTDAERLVIFKKYMVWYNDDSGTMSGDLGYFVGMGDIEDSYDSDDFPDTAKAIYIDLIEDGVIDTYLGTAFTSYGLHVEYLSFLPFYHTELTDLGNGLWVLGIDKELDLAGTVFRTSLTTTLADTINTNTYSAWTGAITSETAEAHTTKNENKIKKLADDLGIEYEE